MSTTYAYARIRNQEKTPEEVRALFTGFHITLNRLYIEERDSFSKKDTPMLKELTGMLEAGDLLVIDSMQSLGDNNMEILTAWEEIRSKHHANIVVVDTEGLDTRLRGRDAADINIADLAMQIFSQTSRQTNAIRKKRQADGIANAKRKGIRFGTARKETPKDFEKYKQMYLNKEIKGRDAAEILGMSHSTFFYRVNH